jgi:IclR family acetate operon transcriptional repressor
MTLDSTRARSPGIRALTRGLDLLDALQRSPQGLRLREISRSAGIPRSTAARYLAALEERRYVDRDPVSGIYRLGLAIPSQAEFTARLKEAVRPALTRLRDRFDETSTFSILDGNRVTMLEIIESRQAIRVRADIGGRNYLHSTAAGKAIAATLSESSIRRVIESIGLPELTPNTITDLDRYLAELEAVRTRGYASTNEENAIGTDGVAVAIPTGRLRAAIGLSAPAVRTDPNAVPTIAEALQKEAEQIARMLAAPLD